VSLDERGRPLRGPDHAVSTPARLTTVMTAVRPALPARMAVRAGEGPTEFVNEGMMA